MSGWSRTIAALSRHTRSRPSSHEIGRHLSGEIRCDPVPACEAGQEKPRKAEQEDRRPAPAARGPAQVDQHDARSRDRGGGQAHARIGEDETQGAQRERAAHRERAQAPSLEEGDDARPPAFRAPPSAGVAPHARQEETQSAQQGQLERARIMVLVDVGAGRGVGIEALRVAEDVLVAREVLVASVEGLEEARREDGRQDPRARPADAGGERGGDGEDGGVRRQPSRELQARGRMQGQREPGRGCLRRHRVVRARHGRGESRHERAGKGCGLQRSDPEDRPIAAAQRGLARGESSAPRAESTTHARAAAHATRTKLAPFWTGRREAGPAAAGEGARPPRGAPRAGVRARGAACGKGRGLDAGAGPRLVARVGLVTVARAVVGGLSPSVTLFRTAPRTFTLA